MPGVMKKCYICGLESPDLVFAYQNWHGAKFCCKNDMACEARRDAERRKNSEEWQRIKNALQHR